jgi:CRISPR-associated Csx14 family protein
MSNVLIATLGESPIVVTSMVRALREKEGISTDILYVIYPQEEGLIPLGFDLIKDHLQGQCEVYPCTLPFPDANSYESSMQFLQTLSELMEHYERSDDVVYLSMAGGRKNMSALMAVICQFFNCVRGLYHILDKYEDYENKRNFYSIEALFDFSENVRNEKLSPPVENLILVKIPYQRFSNATELRRFFSAEQRETFAIEIDAEVDDFFSAIFQRRKTKLLDVYLSEEAYQQYQELGGGYTRKQLKNCLRSMCSPQSLNSHIHPLPGAKMDCKCFKMGSTDERPFYYQTDGEVVVCKVLRHGGQEYQEIANGQRELWSKDYPKVVHISQLEEDGILIVPLGKSPMIATQTYVLLSRRNGVNIKRVAVIHPKNAEIRNGVRLLKESFRRIGVEFEDIEIDELKDLTSEAECQIYLEKLMSLIDRLQNNNPDKSIHLSLSGGRKGMAALTLFAAQQAGIKTVYHTLINDFSLEEQIEKETSLDALRSLTRMKQAERLFLDCYDDCLVGLTTIPKVLSSPTPEAGLWSNPVMSG